MLTQLIFWLALIILPLSAPLILWGTSLPFSMYAMHIIFVFVCAGVYYTDRHLLVRRLLLKKHRLAFILANIALLALGTCLTFLSVRLLLKAPGVSQEQRNLLYSLPVNLMQGAYSFCAMVIAGVAAIAGTATEDLRVSLALNDMLLRERDEARKQKVDSITVKVDLMKRQIRCEDIEADDSGASEANAEFPAGAAVLPHPQQLPGEYGQGDGGKTKTGVFGRCIPSCVRFLQPGLL